MTVLEALAVLLAGLAAGTMNAIVGSGTLITFPVLLAIGYPPVVANMSNTVGLVPGSVSAVWGYRDQLRGRRRRVVRFAGASAAGAVVGAVVLLSAPERAFAIVVPILIAIALVLIVLQPQITSAVMRRRRVARPDGGPLLRCGIFAQGVYGGYFGAAQGILLFALMGTALPDDLLQLNAMRNLLAGVANAVSATVFLLVAPVAPAPAALIAVGSAAGGMLGARIGRRLPATVLRGIIVIVGLTAIAMLVR